MLRRLVRSLARILSRSLSTADVGRRGETLAARHMKRLGFRILGRNLRTSAGELDILCEDPRTRAIVIVEVKARSRPLNDDPRHAPELAVDERKRQRLRLIARTLQRSNHWHDRIIRIDLIAIDFPHDQSKPVLRHHVAIVGAEA